MMNGLLRVVDVEREVQDALIDHYANGAATIHFSCLLSDALGVDVTLGEALGWLVKYSPMWAARVKRIASGVAS